jgi:lipopolysaccharide transport system permease protein
MKSIKNDRDDYNHPFIKTYSPDVQIGWSIRIWRKMFIELITSRELIWRLFNRDFSTRYRQSLIGFVWALILPLIATSTFVFLNYSGLLKISQTGIPYPVFALFGLTIWQAFSSGLTAACNSLVSGGSMVTKINFPKESLVLSGVGITFVDFLVRLLLLVVVLIVFQVIPKWTAIFFPIVMLPLIMFTIGLGFIISLANMVFRDTNNIVNVLISFLMFLTPVVYPVPKAGLMVKIMAVNPLTSLITAARDIVFAGHIAELDRFIWTAIASILLFFVGWRIFHLVESKMAEVI